MGFGKGGGIVDEAEEEKGGTVHDLCAPLDEGQEEGVVEGFPILFGDEGEAVGELFHDVLQEGVSEQGVRTEADSVGVALCLLTQFVGALPCGSHLLTEGVELAIGLGKLCLLVIQFGLDSGEVVLQLLYLRLEGGWVGMSVEDLPMECGEGCFLVCLLTEEVVDHGGETFDTSLCQTDVRLEGGECALMGGDGLLDGRALF